MRLSVELGLIQARVMSLEVPPLKVVDYCASGRRLYFVIYKEVSFQPEEVLEQICITADSVATPVHYNKHQFPSLWLLSQPSVAFYRGSLCYWYF